MRLCVYLMPEKPIELTTFLREDEEQDQHREGGDQGGRHQAGPVRDALRGLRLEHAERTVSTRVCSLLPTSSGQKYSFHMPMKVRMASVAIGAALIGRMIRKKIRKCPAPSSMAASSISRLMPRKNWRRKKIANGVISTYGATMPGEGVEQPQVLDQDEVRQRVKIGGTISAVRNRTNTLSRPGQRSRANA